MLKKQTKDEIHSLIQQKSIKLLRSTGHFLFLFMYIVGFKFCLEFAYHFIKNVFKIIIIDILYLTTQSQTHNFTVDHKIYSIFHIVCANEVVLMNLNVPKLIILLLSTFVLANLVEYLFVCSAFNLKFMFICVTYFSSYAYFVMMSYPTPMAYQNSIKLVMVEFFPLYYQFINTLDNIDKI